MKTKSNTNSIAKLILKIRHGNSLVSNKTLLLIFGLLIISSCAQNPETYIQHIEGYWEIEKVVLSNGFEKEYKFNETIDYISINDSLNGFRKKMKPGLNDTYFTSDDAEAITIKLENDSLNIYYSTPYAKWKETVLEATPKSLRVINENNNVYLYKRYTPIHLDTE